ncbi:MAG: sugar phosphate isomerase/epimerase family protein [Phycisphaeraceae bacterium]
MTWTLSAFADESADSAADQIAALKQASIDHVDLRSVDGINIVELPVEHAERVKAMLDDAGIEVGMYGSPIGKTDIADPIDIELGRLDHLGKMLDVFGAVNVRAFSFYNKAGVPRDDWKTQSFDKLVKLRERCAELGLVLFHENETEVYGDHPDQIVELAELRDANFKLIYDFANYQRTGAEPWANWQRLKPMTDALHFKDQKKSGDHVPIGKGDTMAKEIVADAVKTGWSGPCTLEPHLFMSDAVLSTNVHGRGDTSLEGKTREELFQIAAENAHALMREAGAM